jgi:hypothetical protein
LFVRRLLLKALLCYSQLVDWWDEVCFAQPIFLPIRRKIWHHKWKKSSKWLKFFWLQISKTARLLRGKLFPKCFFVRNLNPILI